MISAILLAAGRSHRYGSDKLQQSIGGRRMIDWSLEAVLASLADEIIVVVSAEAEELSFKVANSGRLRSVINPHPDEGMASSIICGLEACDDHSAAAMIAHGDMPLIETQTLDWLISIWIKFPAKIIAPRYQGQQGNPVIIPRVFWSEIRSLRGDVGCKSILKAHATQVEWLECKDDSILFDIDSFEDMDRLRTRWYR